MKYYYNDRKLVKKDFWGGDKYENNYIEVKYLGSYMLVSSMGDNIKMCLIELPDKRKKEILDMDLIYKRK